jgi:hypothetical protein
MTSGHDGSMHDGLSILLFFTAMASASRQAAAPTSAVLLSSYTLS